MHENSKALALDFTSSVVPELSRAGSQGQKGRPLARDRSGKPGAARDHSRGRGRLSRRDLDPQGQPRGGTSTSQLCFVWPAQVF